MTGETIIAYVAIRLCFLPSLNLIQAPGGRVITSLSAPKVLPPNRTLFSLCVGLKCCVANAIAIWAMSLKTVRTLPGFATASTPPLSSCTRQNLPDSKQKITWQKIYEFQGETRTRQTKTLRRKVSPRFFRPE